MRVKAAVARRPGGRLELVSLDLDEPRRGEIIVRLIASGVARRDREAIAGVTVMPLPFVPGSEGAGIVERVGDDVATPAPGDTVLLAYSACGECPRCIEGDPRHCAAFDARNLSGSRDDGTTPFLDKRRAVHGFFFGQSSFATHLICRAADAIVLDTNAPVELFAAVGGEFLSGAAPLLHHGHAAEDAAVVITGAGLTGLAGCMVAKAMGVANIVVSEPDEARRELALELGATIVVPSDQGLSAVVRAAVSSGARLALEASGTSSGRQACLASVAPEGICAFARSLPSDEDFGGARRHAHDVRIESAETGVVASEIVPRLVAFYRDGHLPISKVVNFFPFELVNDALEAMSTGAVVKSVLRFSLGSFGVLDRARTEGAASDEPSGETVSEPAGDDDGQSRETPVTA